MKATINKSSHGDHTGGKHKGACYYNGRSTVWQVFVSDFDFPIAGFRVKWAAQGMADWINDTNHDCTVGDTVACFAHSDHPAAARFREQNIQEI